MGRRIRQGTRIDKGPSGACDRCVTNINTVVIDLYHFLIGGVQCRCQGARNDEVWIIGGASVGNVTLH